MVWYALWLFIGKALKLSFRGNYVSLNMQMTMKSFLNLFYRITIRNRSFVLLNTLALAVGMAVFILIMLWVQDELAYDKFNTNYKNIVRIELDYNLMGESDGAVQCPAPMASILKEQFPEVEQVVRLRNYSIEQVAYNSKAFTDNDIIFADSTLFSVFSIELIRGSASQALTAPNAITISQSAAKRFFGEEDPMGKILTLDNSMKYEVTAIYKDIPEQSHFHFDCIASLYRFREEAEDIWLSFNFATYVLLKEGANRNAFVTKLNHISETHLAEQMEQWVGSSWKKIKEQGTWFRFSIMDLTDIHLHSNMPGEFEPNGDIRYVVIFVITAVLILLLACVNFINLSTAKALSRTHEIGVKKVFGARFYSLLGQHLAESFILVFLAHFVAMVMVELLLPWFNLVSGKTLAIAYGSPATYLFLLGIILGTTLLAGSYPAFFLSSRRAIEALKKVPTMGARKSRLRNVMVTGQFVISIVLLSCTLMLNKQLFFIQQKDLGYDKNQLLCIWNADLNVQQMQTFKEQLMQNPQVQKATVSGFLPIPSGRDNRLLFKDGIKTSSLTSYNLMYIDYDYLHTLGIELVKGRGFSPDFGSDSLALVINQAAAKAFGWANPIGKTVGVPYRIDFMHNYKVIGVVEDFHYESVHKAIKPLVCFLHPTPGAITLRFSLDTDVSKVLPFLEETWAAYSPDQAFNYTFFQDRLNRLYQSEIKLNRILMAFTVLAFFISCLGLVGLAIFSTEQRKKEIGMRKVIGASGFEVGRLLSFDLTKLVLLAFCIATPIAYYAMVRWLEHFAYATNISWWIFLLAGVLSYLTGVLAIVYQSFRAASANPVDTLRNE